MNTLGVVGGKSASRGRIQVGQYVARSAILVTGIILGQASLYGPSLIGEKVLLPLDILARPQIYLPRTAATAAIDAHNFVLMDLIYLGEPGRRFAVDEFRAGRWPLWNPYQFAGAPFLARFSPFALLAFSVRSPVILAWVQVAMALTAGIGAYVFFRTVLTIGFWPAAVVAWCYPLTGFYIFWQGYGLPCTVAWFPWVLLAVDAAVRHARPWAGAGLAMTTAVTIVSGNTDVAGQVLLASGLFAVWCLTERFGGTLLGRQCSPNSSSNTALALRRSQWWRSYGELVRVLLTLVVGWGLGFLMAAPHLLPMLEYTRTGSRMVRRYGGEEERPPAGIEALPQLVLPDIYGSTEAGSARLVSGNQMESSAAAYSGLLATLLLAPLAWCSQRHRSINICWIILGTISLAWVLDLPLLVPLLRLPGLNMMSHNRFVFVASFGILGMAAVGLEVLSQGKVQRQWWFWCPIGLLVGLLGWCVVGTIFPPQRIVDAMAKIMEHPHNARSLTRWDALRQISWWFSRTNLAAAVLCLVALASWLLLSFPTRSRRWFVTGLSAVMVMDLLWFASGRSAQCDWSLYYPRIPLLEKIAAATPGRVIGANCLPAALAQTAGLQDVRGYDAVDPAQYVELVMLAADHQSPQIPYALTQWLVPRILSTPPAPLRLHPIMDLLGVRYVVFRGRPRNDVKPDFIGNDYWALKNPAALPRVFVPRRVEVVADGRQRLARLASEKFDPREVAYVETTLDLPRPARGTVAIVDENSNRVAIAADMQTPGLIVLADRWDEGWTVTLGGQDTPILRVDHALRGVVVKAGKSRLEFRYQPASLKRGLWLAPAGLLAGLTWLGAGAWSGRRRRAL